MWAVTVETRTRQITVGRYEEAEHARRDAYLRRIAHPRAYCVSAWTPNGHPMIRLYRRDS